MTADSIVRIPATAEGASTARRRFLRDRLHGEKSLQSKIHMAMSHPGRSPVAPRSQYMNGERECPDLSNHLVAISVKITPKSAVTEQRSAERGKGSRSDPTDDGSKPRKAINQAGKSAVNPSSQYCRGRQVATCLLRYGTTDAVAITPRNPRTIESLTISFRPNLTTSGV